MIWLAAILAAAFVAFFLGYKMGRVHGWDDGLADPERTRRMLAREGWRRGREWGAEYLNHGVSHFHEVRYTDGGKGYEVVSGSIEDCNSAWCLERMARQPRTEQPPSES